MNRLVSLAVVLLFLTPLLCALPAVVPASPASTPNLAAEAEAFAAAHRNDTVGEGSVRPATIAGTPTLTSAYVVGNYSAIVFVGDEAWTEEWQSVSNGSQAYTNQLILIAFDITPHDITLQVDAYQAGNGWVNNQSIVLAPLVQTAILVTFNENPNWENAVVLMDGVAFTCQVATPISLLPTSIVNVGGVDLLALGILSEAIVCFAGVTTLAKFLQRKAKFAPRFSLLIWGHVVVIGIAAAVILDYEWVDRTFAGWSPLVYAFAVSPMMFLAALSMFNDSKKAEVLQRVAKPSGRILYRRWLVRYAVLSDGRTVLIDERWRGWLARLFGHHVTIEKGDEFEPVPFEGEFEHRLSPTHSQGVTKVGDRFKVANPQEDDVEKLWWTDTGDPIRVKWPALSVHRLKERVRERVLPDGSTETRKETYMGLTWPHYTEPEVELHRALEDYRAAEAVSAGWANTRDLARVLSKTRTDLYATKAAFSAQVEAEVESRLTAFYSLTGRTNSDLTDEEAKDLAAKGDTRPSLAELLDEGRLRPQGPAPKKG